MQFTIYADSSDSIGTHYLEFTGTLPEGVQEVITFIVYVYPKNTEPPYFVEPITTYFRVPVPNKLVYKLPNISDIDEDSYTLTTSLGRAK